MKRRASLTSKSSLPRARKRDFATLVDAASPSPVMLPMTHVTDGYSFRDIMLGEALIPSPCDIFSSNLLYMFYGRPAYRATSEIESNGSDAYWPVCFVIKPKIVSPVRIYPFDSGAFHHRRFHRFMYHKMIKEDFELEISPETPGKLVRLFWRDEKSYFNADGTSSFAPTTLDFEAKAYQSLINDTGRAPFDERNSAIELQFDTPIDLKDNTIAVILPYEFATPSIISKIDSLGSIALPFDVVRRHGSREMVSQIYTIVRDLFGGQHSPGRCKCW